MYIWVQLRGKDFEWTVSGVGTAHSDPGMSGFMNFTSGRLNRTIMGSTHKPHVMLTTTVIDSGVWCSSDGVIYL